MSAPPASAHRVIPAEVILVHGAFHGGWCWEKVMALLRQAGVTATALDLPFTSFQHDVACVGSAIEASPGPVVLCGHSYGGAVITEAGSAHQVRQLVYLSAFAIAEGCSALAPAEEDLPRTSVADSMVFHDNGTVSLDASNARALFYGDCTDQIVDDARRRLRPMAAECLTGQVTRAAWRDRASLYAICRQDGAFHLDAQRALAAHCDEVVEWESGHSPFFSRPEVVADLLCELAGHSA